MRKKYSLIIISIILTGILSIGIMVFRNGASAISSVEAEAALQDYLVDANQWEDDYVLEPDDPISGKIGNDEVYRFAVRFKDTVEEVGNRLISNYAITVDGNRIFWYDPANDEWTVQESAANQQESGAQTTESINPESFPVGEYQDDMGSQLIISKGDGNQYMVTFGIYKLAYMENAEGNYDVDSGILSFSGTEDMGNTLSADVSMKGENLIVTLTHSEYGSGTCPPGTEFEFKPYQP